MPENLGIYSANEVDTNVNDRTIEGFDEGDFVETERDEAEEFKTRVGAKGDFTFVKNPNKAGRIIIRLKQNAPDNQFLQSLKESEAIFPVEVIARHGYKEIAKSEAAMISIAPRKKHGKEENMREWVFCVGELVETDKAL